MRFHYDRKLRLEPQRSVKTPVSCCESGGEEEKLVKMINLDTVSWWKRNFEL